MKIIMFGGAAAMIVGGVYAYQDRLIVAPNVYAAPTSQVYKVLDAMELPKSGQGPMGTLDIAKTGVEDKTITWAGSGSHARIVCVATLVPLATDRTRVDTQCGGGGPSEGAAAGMGARLINIAMVEQIDSTLRGRPYDMRKVQLASAGSVLGALPQMEGDALKMQAQMHHDIAAHEADRANAPQPSYVPDSAPSMAGQPLDPRGTDPIPTASAN